MKKFFLFLLGVFCLAVMFAGCVSSASNPATGSVAVSSPAVPKSNPGIASCRTGPPAGHDAAWDLTWNSACDTVLNNVSATIGTTTTVSGWCVVEAGTDADAAGSDDPMSQLRQACEDGVRTAVNESRGAN